MTKAIGGKMAKDKGQESFWATLKGFLVIAVLVILIWGATFFWVPYFFGRPDGSGTSGDMFGGITALFSGLAFAGLISTLLMQRSELSLQREELSLTRHEFRAQRFESTLLGLIKMLNEHVASIEAMKHSSGQTSKVEIRKGRAALSTIAERLPHENYLLDGAGAETPGEPGLAETKTRSVRQQEEKYLSRVYQPSEMDLGPYFRLLYGVFRHIDVSDLDENQKKMYSRVARASLSSSELALLFFSCSFGQGREFRGWIEKYGLLKHLPQIIRDANPQLVTNYDTSAFEPIPIPHEKYQ